MVVRQMTKKCDHNQGSPCWACIFEARPDLNPPGYRETIDKIYPQKEEKKDDARVDF